MISELNHAIIDSLIIKKGEKAVCDIIESFVMAKTAKSEECEDVLFIGEHYYAVIDGVTSKFPIKYNGKSAGRYCAEVVAEAINNLDQNADAITMLEALNSAVKKAYCGAQITLENKMQACVIVYNKMRREVVNYGDCQLMINGKVYDHTKRIDTLLEDLRAFTIKSYLAEGGKETDLYANDVGREAIMPFLKKQTLFANKDGYFGYGVIDGTGINESLIKVYKLKEGDTVVLASDGYPKLYPTLSQSEEYLAYVLKADPLSVGENKQTKMKSQDNISFDDRSYLKFTV